MVSRQFKGIIVPIQTPLTPQGQVDLASQRRLVNYLLNNGVHGLWASGTNGEFPALSNRERLLAMEAIVDEVAGRVPIIGNVSLPSTDLTVELGLAVKNIGLDAIGATPPYYFPHSQDEMLDHFRYIRDQVGLPLWIYNIPPMVKTPVAPDTVIELAQQGVVEGIKDSSGTGELLSELNFLCENRNISLYRFIGSVYRIRTARAIGVHGAIPGIANLVPAIASQAWETGESGDDLGAIRWTEKLAIAGKIENLAKGGGAFAARVSGVKAALKLMGIIDHDTVTRPNRPLTEEEKNPIAGILEELGLRGRVGAAASE